MIKSFIMTGRRCLRVMELFNEVKNRYFHIAMKVLCECSDGLNKDEILKIIDDEEFQEKVLGKDNETFSGLMLNTYGDGRDYKLLEERNGLFYPAIDGGNPALPIRFTNIEKLWLKSLTEEKDINTFLKKETLAKMKAALKEVDTPISSEIIEMTNIATPPVIGKQEDYEKNIRVLVRAISEEKAIIYSNTDRHGNRYEKVCSLPVRLEYSLRDRRFRVSMYSMDDERPIMANIHSMNGISICEDVPKIDRETALKRLKENKYSSEPIILEVTDKKAAMERCFMSFSGLERSSRCIEKDKYEIKLSYYMFDEDEIIRKILALGQYVKVISPKRVIDEVIRKIKIAIGMSEFVEL